MAGDDGEHAAPGRLAGADARGAVLEHEDALVGGVEPQVAAAQAVARRVGLAVGDGLGGDEVGRGGEAEDGEPLRGGGFC